MNMHPESIKGRRAIKVGLNPAKTSILGLCCVEHDLPEESSFIQLAAKKAGLSEITISEAEKRFGENWDYAICR